MNSIVENFGPTVATLDDGFSVGVLTRYALNKPIKILSVIAGLVLAILAYLQYQQMAYINWNILITISEDAITTLSHAIIMQMTGITGGSVYSSYVATAFSLAKDSFGIPITASMSAIGFIIGLMKA